MIWSDLIYGSDQILFDPDSDQQDVRIYISSIDKSYFKFDFQIFIDSNYDSLTCISNSNAMEKYIFAYYMLVKITIFYVKT